VTHEDDGLTSRRRALRQLGVGAAVAWTVPLIATSPALAAGTAAPGCPLCPQVAEWDVAGDFTDEGPGRYGLPGLSGSLLLGVTYADPSCGPTPLRITATIEFDNGGPAPLDLALSSTGGNSAFIADWGGDAVLFTAGAPTPTVPGFLDLQVFNAVADAVVISDIVAACL
jgi:hypothetical protein